MAQQVYAHQFKGHVLSCPDSDASQALPARGQGIPIQSAPVWPLRRAALAPMQYADLAIFRRLVSLCSHRGAGGDTLALIHHVTRLSITVNYPKSCLVPSQRATFIGLALDSH